MDTLLMIREKQQFGDSLPCLFTPCSVRYPNILVARQDKARLLIAAINCFTTNRLTINTDLTFKNNKVI